MGRINKYHAVKEEKRWMVHVKRIRGLYVCGCTYVCMYVCVFILCVSVFEDSRLVNFFHLKWCPIKIFPNRRKRVSSNGNERGEIWYMHKPTLSFPPFWRSMSDIKSSESNNRAAFRTKLLSKKRKKGIYFTWSSLRENFSLNLTWRLHQHII